jgi:paraquat-inducible protein A
MNGDLVACLECDLLQREPPVPEGGAARCPRCDAVLSRHRPDSLERTLALTVAGLLLFVVSNAFPFLAFEMQGQVTETTLGSGVARLYGQGWFLVASLVLFTTILAPALQLSLLFYVLVPLRLGRSPAGLVPAFRLVQHLRPWSMMEVFLIGILVALVKLAEMAEIVPGISLWSFAALILVVAGTTASLDPRVVWSRVGVQA